MKSQNYIIEWQRIINMYKFLIYQTKEEADNRADEEGQLRNLPYWQDPVNVTRTWTAPVPTLDGEWGLDVTEYTLTAEENAQVVNDLNVEKWEDPA